MSVEHPISPPNTTSAPPHVANDSRIELDGMGKSFDVDGRSHAVLHDLNARVAAGEFVSIVGPSGTGKTTLLRCIGGLESPTAGSVLIDGRPIDGPPPQLAIIFQDYSRSLLPWLRVRDNVMLPLRSKGVLAPRRLELATESLEAVGLADAADRYPWQLSGGMQQRVAIARALAYEPEALVMDEPFASVDAQTRTDLEDLVLSIRERYRMTVVAVTHDVDEAVYMSDRVLVLGGRPATIIDEIRIDLGMQRNQVTTRSTAHYGELRARVLMAVRSATLGARGGVAAQS